MLESDLKVTKHTTLSAGTRLVFGAVTTWLYVTNTGSLTANGTHRQPDRADRLDPEPRLLDRRAVRRLQLDRQCPGVRHDRVRRPTYGSIADLYVEGTSRVSVSHCTLSDSSGFGFEFNDNPTITFDANTVTRNAKEPAMSSPGTWAC